MDYYRCHPVQDSNIKLFHVIDSSSDAVVKWDPTCPTNGLAAKDRITVPETEKEFHKSITDHFQRLGKKTIYISVVPRELLEVEELKKRAQEKAEKILVLEIDVDQIPPDVKIYAVQNIIKGHEGPWVGDPREEEWKWTYLILHWVPKDAITAYEVEEFWNKGEFCLLDGRSDGGMLNSVHTERDEFDQRHKSLCNEVAKNIGQEYGKKKPASWKEWVFGKPSGDKK